jgi:hypothetical protein
MTKSDAVKFAQCLAVLSETFNESVSEVRAEAYFMALTDLPLDKIQDAVKDAVRTMRFFPKPIELRDLIVGSAQENAEQAWDSLRYEVRRVGYVGKPHLDVITEFILDNTMGGWKWLCKTLPADEGAAMSALKDEFTRAYVREFNTAPDKRIDAQEPRLINGGKA